jgi:cell division protein FtsI (penicillin-binding protein 3)
MMESVVSAQGTAPGAAIEGYRVAGKTGTAQRVDGICHCYRGYTASFIGFAPADKPRYVISVTIQAPQGIHWGGALGAPVFKKVMSFVLQSRHVPPTGTKVVRYPLDASQISKKVTTSASHAKKAN